MCDIRLSDAINYVSVELFVFIFCLMEVLIIAPFPNGIVPPVFLRMSGRTGYDPSTHHLTILVPSARSVSGIWVVSIRYCMIFRTFFQSSSLGPQTRVVKKATAVCISGRDLLVDKSALATKVWNTFALESSTNLYLLSTLKRNSAAGVFAFLSGFGSCPRKSCIISLMYGIIVIFTSPLV